MNADVVVVGGGLVGAAIASGLAKRNAQVVVLDGTDRDFRASNANGGLVWLQGKGMDMPAYQHLTRTSVDRWPDFSADLTELTGIDLQFERNGGLSPCVGEAEFEQRQKKLRRLHEQRGEGEPDWEMVNRHELGKLLPNVELGSRVVGASFGHRDGHANPFRLLSALHSSLLKKGGQWCGGAMVESIRSIRGGGFAVDFRGGQVRAQRVVIAAGLGSKVLGRQVGLDIPIRPQRGQMLVTERLEPFLPLPLRGISQTQQGTVLIGTTDEEVGFDISTTMEAAAAMSAMAIRWLPALSQIKLVRQWAGLRIMTPDGFPIYAESLSHPGAFVAVCHSGVSLAAVHATLLAEAVAAGSLPPYLDVFHHGRFDVPQAA